jgi:hypothetical protein
MPEQVNQELAKEFESLLKDAEKHDREERSSFGSPNEPSPTPKEEKKTPEPEQKEPEAESEPLEDSEESNEPDESPETSKDEKEQKEQTRFDRNWRKFQEEQQAFRKERDEFRKEMSTLRAEKREREDPTLSFKDENGYSVREYQEYQKKLESDGDWEKAYLVSKRGNDLRTKAIQENFRDRWQNNQSRLVEDNPDLGNMATPLAKEVQGLISSQELYRLHPDGITHAVEHAKLKIRAKQASELEAKNKELQSEVTRLNGLLGVGGDGKVHKKLSPSTFSEMSEKDQFAHLLKEAREIDAMHSGY